VRGDDHDGYAKPVVEISHPLARHIRAVRGQRHEVTDDEIGPHACGDIVHLNCRHGLMPFVLDDGP